MESDELSDVDVNSIPVTALSCDATSDSFCDKLPSEDNIDMFLDDRSCIQNEDKNKCPPKDIDSCSVNCITEESEFLTTLSVCDKPQDKDNLYADNTDKSLSSESEIKPENSDTNSDKSIEPEPEKNDQTKSDIQITESSNSEKSEDCTVLPAICATETVASDSSLTVCDELKISTTTDASFISPTVKEKDNERESCNAEIVESDVKENDNHESFTIEETQKSISLDITSNLTKKKVSKKGKRRARTRSSRINKVSSKSEISNLKESHIEITQVEDKSHEDTNTSCLENSNVLDMSKITDESSVNKDINIVPDCKLSGLTDQKHEKFDDKPENDIQLLMETPIIVTDDIKPCQIDSFGKSETPIPDALANSELNAEDIQVDESPKTFNTRGRRKLCSLKNKVSSRKGKQKSLISVTSEKEKISVESEIPGSEMNLNDAEVSVKTIVTSPKNVDSKNLESEKCVDDSNSNRIPEDKCNVSSKESVDNVQSTEKSKGFTKSTNVLDLPVDMERNDIVDTESGICKPVPELLKEKNSKSRKNRKHAKCSKTSSNDIISCVESKEEKVVIENLIDCVDNNKSLNEEPIEAQNEKIDSSKESKNVELNKSKKKCISDDSLIIVKSPRSKRKKEIEAKNNLYENIDSVIEKVVNCGSCLLENEKSSVEDPISIPENLSNHEHEEDIDERKSFSVQTTKTPCKKKSPKKSSCDNKLSEKKTTKKNATEKNENLEKESKKIISQENKRIPIYSYFSNLSALIMKKLY